MEPARILTDSELRRERRYAFLDGLMLGVMGTSLLTSVYLWWRGFL